MPEDLNLKAGQSGCGEIRISANSFELTLEYEYANETGDWVGTVEFGWCLAYRFRGEYFSLGFVQNSFDHIREVKHSAWLREILAQGDAGMVVKEPKHFAVLLSNNGYLEVLAATVKEIEPRKGCLVTK